MNKSISKNYILLSLLLLLFFSGCVYYNTFYNAKKAFQEAEDVREENKYTSGRGNAQKYNLAIEKCLKVIENYPNTKYYDDALYVLAVSYFHTDKFSKADFRFRELLANYPESEYTVRARVYLAKSKLELNENEEAMTLFEEIFVSDVDKEVKTEAAMGLGRFHYGNKNYEEAQPYFMSIRDSLGTDFEKKIAQRFIADGYYDIFQFDNALSAYLQLLGMDIETKDRYHALYNASQCAFALMKIAEGMDYLNKLMQDELYFDSLGVLKLAVAEGLERENDLDGAQDLYLELSQNENKQVAGTSFYRLGLIAQFDKDSLALAKEYYDQAVTFIRSSEIGKDALMRSSDIGKIDEYAQKLVIDSTTSQEAIDEAAFAQFQLSQLFWFNLNKPDTAILEMQYLIDSFPTAYDVPNAKIALSQMIRDYHGDTTAADSILHSILEEHPRSDKIPEVLEVLGLKGTEADTGYAEGYVHKAEDFLIDNENIDSAKYYYQYVVDNYPESNYYLHSRFALLWIMDEYEAPGDSSLYYAYTAFVDSFPGNEWATQINQILRETGTRRTDYVENDSVFEDTVELSEDEIAQIYADSIGVAEDINKSDKSISYLDPVEKLAIAPDGSRCTKLPIDPIETKRPFVYPDAAYSDGWEGFLYFQILLDFSGEVTDYVLKIKSPNEAINREAEETMKTMKFDLFRIPTELQETWFYYKFTVMKPSSLR